MAEMRAGRSYVSAALAAALIAICLAHLLPRALSRPFWHDEIYTVLLARLPSMAAIWSAALEGVDLSPPLNVWLTRGVFLLAGGGHLSARLPSLLGYIATVLLVFVMLRRRAGLTAALTGALLPFFTAGLRYGSEARGYGLMMGFAALALYSWMEAAAGRRRSVHVPLLGFALAASLWNHYFGALVFVPVAAGELARAVRRRRLDGPVAAALAVAVLAAAPLIPLMKAAGSQQSTFWATATGAAQVREAYSFLLLPMLEPVFAAAGLLVALVIGAAKLGRLGDLSVIRRVPAHEAAALGAAVCMPLLGVGLAFAGAGVFVPRYILSAVPGICVAVPLAIWRANTRRTPAELVPCALLVILVAGTVPPPRRTAAANPVADRAVFLGSLRSSSPTVVSSSLQFLPMWYYTPADLRGAMRYLADPDEALAHTGSDTIDRGYAALARWTRIPVESYDAFVARHTSFRVYEAGSGWLLEHLRDTGAAIEVIGAEPGGRLYRVALVR